MNCAKAFWCNGAQPFNEHPNWLHLYFFFTQNKYKHLNHAPFPHEILTTSLFWLTLAIIANMCSDVDNDWVQTRFFFLFLCVPLEAPWFRERIAEAMRFFFTLPLPTPHLSVTMITNNESPWRQAEHINPHPAVNTLGQLQVNPQAQMGRGGSGRWRDLLARVSCTDWTPVSRMFLPWTRPKLMWRN